MRSEVIWYSAYVEFYSRWEIDGEQVPRERGGGFETSDILFTVLTSAALPVASCILTLPFGDNSLSLSTDYSLSILHHFQDGY